jgi:hypothetical protein
MPGKAQNQGCEMRPRTGSSKIILTTPKADRTVKAYHIMRFSAFLRVTVRLVVDANVCERPKFEVARCPLFTPLPGHKQT